VQVGSPSEFGCGGIGEKTLYANMVSICDTQLAYLELYINLLVDFAVDSEQRNEIELEI